MKGLRLTLAIAYDLVILSYSTAFLINTIYQISLVSASENSIGIIGAADLPASLFLLSFLLLPLLFTVIGLAAAILLTVAVIKNKETPRITLFLCLLIALSLALILLIPTQSYAVALYVLLKKIPLLIGSKWVFVLLSLANIVFLVLPKVRKNR